MKVQKNSTCLVIYHIVLYYGYIILSMYEYVYLFYCDSVPHSLWLGLENHHYNGGICQRRYTIIT